MGREVTIECKLDRIAFFPGDVLRVKIYLHNLSTQSTRPTAHITPPNATFPSTIAVLESTSRSLTELSSISEAYLDLDWFAVQIHGSVSVQSSWVILPPHPVPPKTQVTVDGKKEITNFGEIDETGRCTFVTKPMILIENDKIAGVTSREFQYSVTLPASLPPSFKGTAVKYSYHIAIGIQEKNQRCRVLKVPFKMLVKPSASACLLSIFPGYPDMEECGAKVKENVVAHKQSAALTEAKVRALAEDSRSERSASVDSQNANVDARSTVSTKAEHTALATVGRMISIDRTVSVEDIDLDDLSSEDSDTPVDPFSIDPDGFGMTGWGGNGLFDHADSDPSDHIAPPAAPTFYNIRRGNEQICRFSLGKESFRVGDLITGTFDFTQGIIPCHQISVTLESEETVSQAFLHQHRASPSPAGSSCIRKVYGEHHELTYHTRHTHFMFFIPFDAPAVFSTDLVSLRYVLHLEFMVTSATQTAASKPPRTHKGKGKTLDVSAIPLIKSSDAIVEWPTVAGAAVDTLQWRTVISVHNPYLPVSGGQAALASVTL